MLTTGRTRPLELALWLVLAGSTAYGAFYLYRVEGTRFVAPVHAQQSASDTDGPIAGSARGGSAYGAASAVADGTVIGEVSIPALRLSVPMVEGLSKQDLMRGVGHVPGSATPGGLGNIAVAAHRDTFFRPLRNIKPGMDVLVRSAAGTYRYQVERTEVVMPEQVAVLEIGTVPELTMITCYPFDFIGAAPKRMIVHARLTSLVPIDNPR